MARRRRRIDEVKHEHRRQVSRRWQASGPSVQGICGRERIPESQFWGWKRRLAGEWEAVPAQAEPAFVPVTIVEPSAPPRPAIDIRLSSGHRSRRLRLSAHRFAVEAG